MSTMQLSQNHQCIHIEDEKGICIDAETVPKGITNRGDYISLTMQSRSLRQPVCLVPLFGQDLHEH